MLHQCCRFEREAYGRRMVATGHKHGRFGAYLIVDARFCLIKANFVSKGP